MSVDVDKGKWCWIVFCDGTVVLLRFMELPGEVVCDAVFCFFLGWFGFLGRGSFCFGFCVLG